MCVREYPNAVNSSIIYQGQWPDCGVLGDLWMLPPKPGSYGAFQNCGSAAGGQKLYVEIGANIGACLVPMLARPDVTHAVAFEPNPSNLFYLTNSVLSNAGMTKKLTLFPAALGDVDSTKNYYVESGNAGNTVLDTATHANKTVAGQVMVLTLDEIFITGGPPPYIHLLKVDAQGYEVKIFKGGEKLLSSGAINSVKFEIATDWLSSQGTSVAEYLNIFIQNGFNIHAPGQLYTPSSDATLLQIACGPATVTDMLALYTGKSLQSLIRCA